MKRDLTPMPIVVGNVTLRWVKACRGCPGGYPLPGGTFTRDVYVATVVAENIAALSKPAPLDPPAVRELREGPTNRHHGSNPKEKPSEHHRPA